MAAKVKSAKSAEKSAAKSKPKKPKAEATKNTSPLSLAEAWRKSDS
jgi:hypothetical protein